MIGFTRSRFPRKLHNHCLEDYNEINALGHWLLWLAGTYRENEQTHLLTNETTSAGTPIILLITTKRVLVIDMTELPHPVLLFEVLIVAF